MLSRHRSLHCQTATSVSNKNDLARRHIASIKELPPAEGVDQVRVAGELEWERSEEWSTAGVPIHRDQISNLAEVCTANRCDLPEGWPAA